MPEYTIAELALEAGKRNIGLGDNPARTVRYYVSIGLLPKPLVRQSGKRRVSCYGSDFLTRLKAIDYLKREGLSLNEIKDKIHENIYWSAKGFAFMSKYSTEIPQNELTQFLEGMVVKRYQFAFLLVKLRDEIKSGESTDRDVLKYFMGADGSPMFLPQPD